MKITLPAAGIMLIVLLLVLSSGCSSSTRINYDDGRLTVYHSNESVSRGCFPGHTNCSFSCVDLQEDDFNCGSCGVSCNGLGRTCLNGSCTCKPGYVTCDGVCTNLKTDLFNCGACGTVCPVTQTCTDGRCGCGVNALDGVRMTDCGGSCSDTSIDPDNCGSCGHRCPIGDACMFGMCQSR